MKRHRIGLLVQIKLVVLAMAAWGWLSAPSPGLAGPTQTCPPVASTQYFTFVYGSVTLGGSSASVGTVVEARTPRGNTVGCISVQTSGQYPLMYIYGEETIGGVTTPGMRTDELAAFYVNGVPATPIPAFAWRNSWASTRVDLTAGGEPTHTPRATPTPTPTLTATPTHTATATPVFVAVSPDTGATLSYTATEGATLTLQIPANAVTDTIDLMLQVTEPSSSPPGFIFGGQGFMLVALHEDTQMEEYVFLEPMVITIEYSEVTIGQTPEASLLLFFFDVNSNQWIDAATTCTPVSAYSRNEAENLFSVAICHLTEFAVFGQDRQRLYLPYIQR